MLALGTPGCVLPESLDVVDDTEVNHPPAIVATDPPVTELATITCSGTGCVRSRDFTLTLEDQNLGDTLHIRFFVDYVPTPTQAIALADVGPPTAPKPGDFRRAPKSVTIRCFDPTMPLDPGVPADGAMHDLLAVVADRAFIDDGQMPLFRHLPPDTVPAEAAWKVICQ
jgi:hypothetical protein